MAVTSPAITEGLASRLRNVHVDLRDDLEVSRHVFQGEPSYVLRDPVSFQSHRFELDDYRVLVAISSHESLGCTFDRLVKTGALTADRENEYYTFILSLHRSGLLNLPIADGQLLYRRHKTLQQTKRRQLLLAFVYLNLPLWNPDLFLNRTVRFVRFMFTRPFFAAWLGLVLTAVYVGVTRRREMADPLMGVLAVQNLLLMWLSLSVLKFIHELGHAYACKVYGLHVPTLGVYLVAGVPCAYVDASASWGLARRGQRIVIALAGMYFETIVAAVAMLVWAVTSPGLVNSIAFNTVFLAGVATLFFNINPLMKYDGYFVLGDLVGVPNFGQRARTQVVNILKRICLGLTTAPDASKGWRRTLLTSYGIAAPAYRTIVLVAIASVLAARFSLFGLALGGAYLCFVLVQTFHGTLKYLWRAEETAPVRLRATLVSAAALVLIPAVLIAVPVRLSVQAPGAVRGGTECVIRTETPGFLTDVLARSGDRVEPGSPLVQLANDLVDERVVQAETKRAAAEVRRDAYRSGNPSKAIEEGIRVLALDAQISHFRRQAGALNAKAPQQGEVIMHLRPRDIGRFIPKGVEIATIITGRPLVQILLTAEESAAVLPKIGQRVECRVSSIPGRTVSGVIEHIDPAGRKQVDIPSLMHVAGGDIAVRPETGEAMEPYFLLSVRLSSDLGVNGLPLHGTKASVRLPSRWEPIGIMLYRRMSRFVETVQRS